jgi:hypothetical protein
MKLKTKAHPIAVCGDAHYFAQFARLKRLSSGLTASIPRRFVINVTSITLSE